MPALRAAASILTRSRTSQQYLTVLSFTCRSEKTTQVFTLCHCASECKRKTLSAARVCGGSSAASFGAVVAVLLVRRRVTGLASLASLLKDSFAVLAACTLKHRAGADPPSQDAAPTDSRRPTNEEASSISVLCCRWHQACIAVLILSTHDYEGC